MGSGGITILELPRKHIDMAFHALVQWTCWYSKGGVDLEGLEVSGSMALMFFSRVVCWCSCGHWREELRAANCTCAFFYKERIRKKGDHSLYAKSSLILKHIWLKLKTESLVLLGCIHTGLHLLGALGLFCQLSLAVYLP